MRHRAFVVSLVASLVCSPAVAEDVAAMLKRCEEACSRLGPYTQFTLERDTSGWRAAGVEMNGAALTDANVAALVRLGGIESLVMGAGTGSRIEARGKFRELTRLKRLSVEAEVSDAGLEGISGITGLEDLELTPGHRLQSESFAHLKALKNLRRLVLRRMSVDADAWAAITSLKGLEELQFDQCGGVDGNLPGLGRLARLRRLGMDSRNITATGAEALATLSKLEVLSVERWVGRPSLAALKGVRELQIGGYADGVDPAAGVLPPNLRRLAVMYAGGAQKLDRAPELKRLVSLAIGDHSGGDGEDFQFVPKMIAGLPRLTELKLTYVNGREEDFIKLKDVESLRSLELEMCTGGDDEVKVAMQLKRLESLTINAIAMGSEHTSVARLSSLKELRHLDLRSSCTGLVAGLDVVKSMPELRTLRLSFHSGEQQDGDVMLTHVRGLDKLEELSLDESNLRLTDEGLKNLAGLKKLRRLGLTECGGFSDKGLAALVDSLPELRTLRVSGVQRSGDGKTR